MGQAWRSRYGISNSRWGVFADNDSLFFTGGEVGLFYIDPLTAQFVDVDTVDRTGHSFEYVSSLVETDGILAWTKSKENITFKTWVEGTSTSITQATPSDDFELIGASDGKLYAIVNATLQRSDDQGSSWTTLRPQSAFVKFIARGKRLVILEPKGIAVSGDRGSSWTSIALPTANTFDIDLSENTLYISAAKGQVFSMPLAPLGVAGTSSALFPSLYPNPVESSVRIDVGGGNVTAVLFDAIGRQLRTQTLSPSRTSIDCSNLPSGLYTIRLTDDRQTTVQKFYKR